MFKNLPGLLAVILLVSALPTAGEQLRDPTMPLQEIAPPQRQEASFQLNAILSGQQRSNVAIINGNTVAKGEVVDGATVISILPDRVHLQHGSRQLELRLHSSSVRSDALDHKK